jgi:glycosyltransferase involved in cell wall biosynthesis
LPVPRQAAAQGRAATWRGTNPEVSVMAIVRKDRVLLVVLSDRLSGLIEKGEITPRYYNPGELFHEVHLLLTNDDAPDTKILQETVGGARLFVHNLPAGRSLFWKSACWRPRLLRNWALSGVEMARRIRPDVIRCYGNNLNGFLAAQMRRALGTPLVISLHVNADEDLRGRAKTFSERLLSYAALGIEEESLRAADLVLPVYEPIVPYLEKRRIAPYRVCYNFLNATDIRRKSDYRIRSNAKLIGVGRQFAAKNPRNVLSALKELPGVSLTLVGNGPLHGELRSLAAKSGLGGRVVFVPRMENDALCRSLPEYDLFVAHSEFFEIGKAVLEALLAGLPVVINRRQGRPVPEFRDGVVRLVPDSPEGYLSGIRTLLANEEARRQLGTTAWTVAQGKYAPAVTEAVYAKVYRSFLN